MKISELKDGTWTRRVLIIRGGTWCTTINRTWVINGRFRRARFVLVGGPTILVSGADLQAVLDETVPVRLICPLRIDLEKSTINNRPVQLEIEP
jgi:hypothetical protein